MRGTFVILTGRGCLEAEKAKNPILGLFFTREASTPVPASPQNVSPTSSHFSEHVSLPVALATPNPCSQPLPPGACCRLESDLRPPYKFLLPWWPWDASSCGTTVARHRCSQLCHWATSYSSLYLSDPGTIPSSAQPARSSVKMQEQPMILTPKHCLLGHWVSCSLCKSHL